MHGQQNIKINKNIIESTKVITDLEEKPKEVKKMAVIWM
jgi:hypothetical protein